MRLGWHETVRGGGGVAITCCSMMQPEGQRWMAHCFHTSEWRTAAHLHAADDHAGDNLAGVVDDSVLGCVHVQGGHAGDARVHHAQLLQPLHACSSSGRLRCDMSAGLHPEHQ